MGVFRNPVTIDNTGTLGGTTNPTTSQALPMERENQRAIRELVGAFGYEALTIASGSITPTKAEITVDTEAGASADDLTTILLVSDGTTILHDGMLLKIRAYDPARVVTVRHNTGTNQIQTLTGTDVVLGTTWELTLKLVSGVWKEVAGKPVVDIPGNAATATSATSATTATTANTLKQGGLVAPTSGGSSTAYTVTSSPVVSALAAGNVYQFKAHTACGAAPTVNFDGLGAKTLKKFSGGSKADLVAGDIPSGALVQCLYDGADMVVAGAIAAATTSYDSGEQTITAGGSLTLAHGLGVTPKTITAVLRCKTAELGYSVGDDVLLGLHQNDVGTAIAGGQSLRIDATNIRVKFGASNPTYRLISITDGTTSTITNANWRLILRAYA